VTLRLLPARPDSGVAFVRTDLPDKPVIPARADNVVDTELATTLGAGDVRIHTVEHLLAALAGLGIDNARIEVDGPEVPIMDGSASAFIDLVREAGVRLQEKAKSFLVIKKPIVVSDGDKRAALLPGKGFRVECTIDFQHPLIHDQALALSFNDATFRREVSRARTFGFLRDVERLKAAGLAKGGSLENAIVVDDFSILNPDGLRFPDEFVRHKVLDAVGDVSLLGLPVVGTLQCYKSGHRLHHALVRKVLADATQFNVLRTRVDELEQHDVGLDELEDSLTAA
jgi:UDP-3-O-[3-hydroxymyristoyl] N-acetylglucosamine deacetylase